MIKYQKKFIHFEDNLYYKKLFYLIKYLRIKTKNNNKKSVKKIFQLFH